MKIGVVGFGYWGPNLVRNFNSVPSVTVEYVCELRSDRLEAASKVSPKIKTTRDVSEIINHPNIDAVVIATPVFTHFDLAKKILNSGKHVLIEKPMTASSDEATELIELAAAKNRILMVDHTFLYTGAVQKMHKLVNSGDLGKITYFDSTRINLGLFQPDVNVLWDLAPHDISILNYLIEERPVSVNATGVSHTNNSIENIAYMTINYQSGMIAHFNCSWTSPVKIRMTLLGGSKKMVVYNDMEPTEKIRIYDTGYNVKTEEEKLKILIDYRVGDIFIPKINTTEALFVMANDFINAIQTGATPVSSSSIGLDVVKILEASQKSIKENGKEIKLNN
jgi:predicted dehydrogenase